MLEYLLIFRKYCSG